jgi:hypothetical protein
MIEVQLKLSLCLIKHHTMKTYVVQPKISRNFNAARKPLVVQLWASRYRELYPL